MKLSKKIYLNLDHKQKQVIKELIWHVTKLHNIANFNLRENGYKSYNNEYDQQYKLNWHSDYLYSHNRQQALKKLNDNWKSYFKAIKDYKENPSKYTGRPNRPGFKNVVNNPGEVVFTKAGFSQSFNDNKNPNENLLILSLGKKMQDKYQLKSLNLKLTEKVLKLMGSLENINQVTIKKDYYSGEYYLNVVYVKDETELKDHKDIMSIDLGLDNLATISFLESEKTYIIDGKKLKSKRKYFDKEISFYQSIRMKQTGSKRFKDTKKIKKLRKMNKDYQLNFLHHAANQIIDLAITHKVRTIVMGDLKNIKKGMKNNKSFVKAPLTKLKELVEYKANLIGINYKEQNEAYTSGCSALDLEPLKKEFYNKARRFTRGLFKSNKGLVINADVNGSLNILRKYMKMKCIPKLIKLVRDNGVMNAPKRISVACC